MSGPARRLHRDKMSVAACVNEIAALLIQFFRRPRRTWDFP
jgi:hypothetical protein